MKFLQMFALVLWSSCGALALSGCSIFPYDNKFLCEKTDDYGHCTSVQGAYQDATNGDTTNADAADVKNDMVKKPDKSHDKCCDGDSLAAVAPADAEPAWGSDSKPARPVYSDKDAYRNAQYRAMAGLVDQPVAPVLAPAKVVRTLILAYSDGLTMFMPRYVFTVVDKPHFVMGNTGIPVPGAPTIYPNGRERDSLIGGSR